MSPFIRKIIAVIVVLVVANVGFVWYGQASFDTTFQSLAKAFSENNATAIRQPNPPAAIARQIERSKIAQNGYGTIVLQLEGTYRRKPSSKAIAMHALALLRPTPDMLWAVRLESNPIVTFNALETYHGGRAKMQTMLFGIIPTGEFDSEAFAKSELTRVLAYALFNPALLACECIAYEPVDAHRTRATISDGGISVTVLFESDEKGDIVKVTSDDRVRPVKGGMAPAPWQMTVQNYGDLDGLRIPVSVEEAWILEGKPAVYADYRVTSAKRL
ncbi:DUF6544 family protein [Hydrogenimonas sp.]